MVTAVALPLALLLGVEAALRLVGYGYDPAFTRPCEIGGMRSVCDNPGFTQRFFPARIARTAPSFAFSADKGRGTYRIFVLGASAAQGDPDPTFGFSRILEVLLEERYPGVRFEVVNSAITAVNSHVVRLIARDLSRRQGDLFVVYLGNNEIVGPYGPGSVFRTMPGSLGLIRSSILLRGSRLGQLVDRSLGAAGDDDVDPEWRGMEFFLGHRVRFDDPRLESSYAHFRANLGAIVNAAVDASAPVLLCTVPVNLDDSAPFASEHRADLDEAEHKAWSEAYRRGIEAQEAGRPAEALDAFREAERIDATFAELQFRMGLLLRAFGLPSEARERFAAARDHDTLRFRADSRTNEIIRSVARDRGDAGVQLVDAEKIFETAGEDGELFLDHVHLTFEGNHVLAVSLLDEVERILPDHVRSRTSGVPVPTRDACAAHLAHTGFDRHRVAALMQQRTSRPPFTNRFDHAAREQRYEEQVDSLRSALEPPALVAAEETYRAAIERADDDPWLRFNHANLLAAMERHRGAESEMKAFLTRLPHDLQGRERLAAALAEQGRFEESVAECRTAVELAPHLPTARYTMAYALANLGRLDESIAVYRELLEVDPGSWDRIHNEIGRIEMHRNRLDAAMAAFEDAIRMRGRFEDVRIPDVFFNYGIALQRKGREKEARGRFREAADEYRLELEETGGSAVLHMALGGTLLRLGEADRALGHFGKAASLDPSSFDTQAALVRTLEALGRHEEAGRAAADGIHALEDAGRDEDAARLRRMVLGRPLAESQR